MAEQSKADSFTAYLEAKRRRRQEKAAQPGSGGTAFSILAVLGENEGWMPLGDLQAASGMSFTSFAEAIKRLRDSDYLTLSGAPGSESAELTRLGREVASLARPA